MLTPIIRIISPTDPTPARLSAGPVGIRRWRGARGTLGDLTLQLPSQGLTSGARLALARQGCATGSFRLNCAESLYVKDERGLAMFQRIELEEELDKARLGLRERPPMLATGSAPENSEELTNVALDTITATADSADQPSRKTRRPSLRTQKRNMLASQGMRFDSGGLSSCVTFTEGLCHLEDYVRASENNDSAASDFPTVHSEQEIIDLVATGETPKLSWLDSLRKKTFAAAADKSSGLKKRRSTNEISRSFSCVDISASLSEVDLTFSVDTASSSSEDSSHMMEGQMKSLLCQSPEDDEVDSASTGTLRREGSWTRLRRRFSRRLSILKNLNLPVDDQALDSPTSIASGLFQIIQQGVASNFSQPKLHVYR
ncbi:hypothetical protein A7U60_g8142 [Sanghuangporus baumii]|uniref:Uncharacterized protein n=1 Tax=Sanghuangporus baumii TaxID=108892 RepID=A0A9Q5HS53_SANBA|nr:hypothetical protein A7U60_g8142 [Sanghuangporus baumii]